MTLIDVLTQRADGTVPQFAWPGGYPMFYLAADGECICSTCVNENIKDIVDATIGSNDEQWEIVGADVNWEDAEMVCAHCNARIPSAYGDTE